MTMHVVLGDGEMTKKELTETLSDLWKADEEAEQTFWFVIQGKSDPSTTDQNLVKWMESNDIYYEVITDDADAMHAVYTQPQDTHVAKQLSRKVLNLLNSKPEEGEEAELLALFFSDDSSATEDRWLNQVCQDVFDAGFKVRALNDGLLEVDLAPVEEEEEPAEEEADNVVPIKKAAAKAPAKKAAAKKAAASDTEVSEEDEVTAEADADEPLTREALEELELPALKEIAAAKGLSFPPRTRMTTYIDAILGEDRPSVEVTPVDEPQAAALNGVNVDDLADLIADRLIQRLAEALQ